MEKIKLEYVLAVYRGEESGNITAWVVDKNETKSLVPKEVMPDELKKKFKVKRLL